MSKVSRVRCVWWCVEVCVVFVEVCVEGVCVCVEVCVRCVRSYQG